MLPWVLLLLLILQLLLPLWSNGRKQINHFFFLHSNFRFFIALLVCFELLHGFPSGCQVAAGLKDDSRMIIADLSNQTSGLNFKHTSWIHLLIYFWPFHGQTILDDFTFPPLDAGPAPWEGEEFLTGWPGSSGAIPPRCSHWGLPAVDGVGAAGGLRRCWSGGLQGPEGSKDHLEIFWMF